MLGVPSVRLPLPGLDAAALQEVQPQLVPVGPGGLGTVLVQQPQWAPPAGADGAQPANIIYFHKVEQYGVGAQPLVSTQPVVAVQPGAELDQTVILPAQPARPGEFGPAFCRGFYRLPSGSRHPTA